MGLSNGITTERTDALRTEKTFKISVNSVLSVVSEYLAYSLSHSGFSCIPRYSGVS